MRDVRALIVGIDIYEAERWSVDGPGHNAIAIADWLLARGIQPDCIHLFLSGKSKAAAQHLDRLQAVGIAPVLSTSARDIEKFWREDLLQKTPKTKLFVYWSGHGCTNMLRRRCFYYEDYTGTYQGAVLDVEAFLATLRTPAYRHFAEQVILADVCGVYRDISQVPPPVPPQRCEPLLQVGCFASPEGDYAYVPNENGLGEFTFTALKVLEDWPSDWRLACDSIVDAFEEDGRRPHHFYFDHPDYRFSNVIAGQDTALRQSCLDVLSHCAVPDEALLEPYRRTVNRLRRGDLLSATRLTDMLRALCGLDGDDAGAPHGLIEFLVRLQAIPGCSDQIAAWLNTNVALQRVESVRAEIAGEGRKRQLILVMENDDAGGLSGYRAVQRYADGSPAGDSIPFTPLTRFEDLENSVRTLIAGLRDKDDYEDLHIRVLANPPLFHLPFHRIRLSPGEMTLGEEFPLSLHHKDRMCHPVRMSQTVRDYDVMLRQRLWKEVAWRTIVIGQPLSAEKALWVTAFPPPSGKTGMRGMTELIRALKLGIPYLCLPECPGAPDDIDSIPGALKAFRAGHLDDVPKQFYEARVRGDTVATQSALLWDDPQFTTFMPVRRGTYG